MRQGHTGPRLSFQEMLHLVPLPPADSPSGGGDNGAATAAGNSRPGKPGPVRRYMSTRAAWVPGLDLFPPETEPRSSQPLKQAAFGGHVYSQAGLAACLALEEDQADKGGEIGQGLHAIHGFFTEPGYADRPYVYDVSTLSSNAGFGARLVTVRQPPEPSPGQDHFSPDQLTGHPLGPVCFSAMLSFKRPEPHSRGVSTQQASAWGRYAAILSQRAHPSDWDPSPPVDIDGIAEAVGRDVVGTFPIMEARKVDMTAYNAARPAMEDKRQLILYRLLRPLRRGTTADANRHALAHAYMADRNGLLMMANLLGWGDAFGRAASLSYSFVVHTNVDGCVMRHADELGGDGAGAGEWWLQEACFPRTGNGRGIIMSKIWSPEGVHVATEYQDGICRPLDDSRGRSNQFTKL